MNQRTKIVRRAMQTALGFALVALLSACTIRLISEYDAETDKGVTQLQSAVATHLATLAQLSKGLDGAPVKPACQYENFGNTYAQLAAQARVLVVRNEVRIKNEQTTQQLKSLTETLEKELPELHRSVPDRCMTQGTVEAARTIVEQHFRAILKLELAKKIYRGAN
jgi:pyruvate/2-oxoacid:ferredoxin oxidoreductase beta subunit